MNISTDKLTNETNQLTYKIHLILLKNKDTLVLNQYFNPRIKYLDAFFLVGCPLININNTQVIESKPEGLVVLKTSKSPLGTNLKRVLFLLPFRVSPSPILCKYPIQNISVSTFSSSCTFSL